MSCVWAGGGHGQGHEQGHLTCTELPHGPMKQPQLQESQQETITQKKMLINKEMVASNCLTNQQTIRVQSGQQLKTVLRQQTLQQTSKIIADQYPAEVIVEEEVLNKPCPNHSGLVCPHHGYCNKMRQSEAVCQTPDVISMNKNTQSTSTGDHCFPSTNSTKASLSSLSSLNSTSSSTSTCGSHLSQPVLGDKEHNPCLSRPVFKQVLSSRVRRLSMNDTCASVSMTTVSRLPHLPVSISPVWLFLLLVLSAFTRPVLTQCTDASACNPKPVDLVDMSFGTRSLDVTSECGLEDNTEGHYRRIKTTLDDTDYTCVTGSHGKELMIDYKLEQINISGTPLFNVLNSDLDTYWQSENTIVNGSEAAKQECVTVALGDPFLIRSIEAIFVSPHTPEEDTSIDMRPRATAFYIQVDGEWKAVRYYSEDCATTFPGVISATSEPNFNATTTVCVESFYSTDEATFTGWQYSRQQVIFSPGTEFKDEFNGAASVQRHYTGEGVRMCMLDPADNFHLSSYYAIGAFKVMGSCSCYGHGDSCTGANKEMCSCGHNTQGDHCEECLPLYNNKPWAVGYGNLSNACQDCGCNGHALSCVYDLDKGHGVCEDCTDRTTGDKCEWCVEHYYVNPIKDSYNASVDPAICTALNGSEEITYGCGDWCIPCNCSVEGTVANEIVCNNGTGQCNCKQFVEGRTCDECMDGYWNLQEASVDGCQECVCSEAGTVNGSLCDKVTGRCTCKDNVEGSDCDVCKPGTFNLTSSNPAGCASCGCDLGAATVTTCDNATGSCDCREGIIGRDCNQPLPGRYVPRLDYLTFEAELTDNAEDFEIVERSGHGTLDSTLTGRGFVRLPAESTLMLEVVVPKTFDYNLVVRYESTYSWSNFGLVFRAVNASDDPEPTYQCAGETHEITTDLYDSADLPAADSQGGVELLSSDMCLRADTVYTVSLSVPVSEPPGGSILLDSIVLLPNVTLLNAYNHSSPEIQDQIEACYQSAIPVDLRARENGSCDLHEYSVMAELFGEALLCYCEEEGSLSSVCEAYTGQCSCQPNVILQDCSQCAVGYYNYTSGQGCTACGCDTLGSLPRTCNETGACLCQPNVVGLKCDQCLPDHYGLATGEGCKPCTCNELYSLNNSCMDNAQCHCKPGVGGANCDKCIDGAFDLSPDGCDLCGCDDSGSFDQGCDPQDGTCLCRRNVEGSKCDACKEGYYGLGDWTPLGCLQCSCSGHSSNCTSATGWFRSRQESNWSLLDDQQAIQDIWTGSDGEGNPVTVTNPIIIDDTDSQYVMRIQNNLENIDKSLYFVATDKFLGNKASAYNQGLNVTVGHFIPSPQIENFEVEYLNNTMGDVILRSRQFNLVTSLPQPSIDGPTMYQFMLNEDQWTIDSVDGPNPTYMQMIQALSDLMGIWVNAKYTNVTNSYSNLYEASIEFSAEVNATTNIPANNVEQCVCPEEYTGQFCEQCAPGYQRNPHNSGPYSECIPCACNNHGDPDIPCDPETGMCTCRNNTEGDHCQLCAAGYYGDATEGTPDDCQPCMCPGNVVESAINVFADTCVLKSGGGFTCTDCTEGHGGDRCEYCTENYYGMPEVMLNNNGVCSPCECNGRADICNSTTGVCIDCRNNTAGKECEICAPGYHGNAMTYSCEPCDCTAVGATGECNPSTGQCVCHPNVMGFLCEGPCEPNTFNYSSGLGCEPCGCHEEGATGPSCNEDTGQCVCRDFVSGRQCNDCEDTFWNITPFGCSPCGCTEAGTLNDTSSVFGMCDLDSGQCECALPGIIGRTCDHCATGTLGTTYTHVTDIYMGQYPQCELCGECYDNWARKIDDVGLKIEELYSDVLQVWGNYDNLTQSEVQPVLNSLQSNLTGVTSSIQTAQEMVDSLTYLQDGFTQTVATVENLTSVLSLTSARLASVQLLLDSIQAFDGAVQTRSRGPQTPEQINAHSLQLQQDLEELYQTGETAYLKIQRMSQIIANSTNLVQSLMDDVSTATRLLGSARLNRETASILLSGTLAESFSNNAETLSNLGENLASVNSNIDSLNTSSIENAQDVDSTNTSVQENLGLAQNKMAAIQGWMSEAQKAKANVTQAEATVETAVGEVRKYMSTAVTTKQTSQVLIEGIVQENQKIPSLNEQSGASQRMVAEIDAIEIQSLGAMQSLISDINGTSVAQTEVNDMLRKASAARQSAEEAQEITQLAEQESQTTLEYVRQINSNLLEGSRTNDTVLNDLDRSQQAVSTVENTLTEVQTTVDEGNSLADSTGMSLSTVENLVLGVSQCFTDKSGRIEQATGTAESAENLIEQVTLKQMTSDASATQASSQLSQLESLTDAAYDQVTEAEDEMSQLQAEMDALEEVGTLQALNNNMVTQLIQMELLERDLGTYRTEIDELLVSLTELQQQSEVSCTRN